MRRDPKREKTLRDTSMHAARMYEDVLTYASLGPHRSGSAGDAATVEWLHKSIPPSWYVEEERQWMDRRFAYDGCTLTIDGDDHRCFGVWQPNISVVRDMHVAHFVPSTSGRFRSRAIALVDIGAATLSSTGAGDAILAAINAGAAAVVICNVIVQGTPYMAAINAPPPFGDQPWRVPVAVVGEASRAALLRPGALVSRLHVQGRIVSGGASSLFATTRAGSSLTSANGSARSSVRIVVSTPTTGCADERSASIPRLDSCPRRGGMPYNEHALMANRSNRVVSRVFLRRRTRCRSCTATNARSFAARAA